MGNRVNYYAHTAEDGEGRQLPEQHWQPLAFSLARQTGEGGRMPGEGSRWHKRRTISTSAAPDYPDSASGFRAGTAPCATENHVIPAFLEMVFDQPANILAN